MRDIEKCELITKGRSLSLQRVRWSLHPTSCVTVSFLCFCSCWTCVTSEIGCCSQGDSSSWIARPQTNQIRAKAVFPLCSSSWAALFVLGHTQNTANPQVGFAGSLVSRFSGALPPCTQLDGTSVFLCRGMGRGQVAAAESLMYLYPCIDWWVYSNLLIV